VHTEPVEVLEVLVLDEVLVPDELLVLLDELLVLDEVELGDVWEPVLEVLVVPVPPVPPLAVLPVEPEVLSVPDPPPLVVLEEPVAPPVPGEVSGLPHWMRQSPKINRSRRYRWATRTEPFS
jgi:hypothetical protein